MKLPEIFKNKIEYPNNKCYISSNKDIYTSFPFKAIITTNNYSNKGIIVFGKTPNSIEKIKPTPLIIIPSACTVNIYIYIVSFVFIIL